MGTSSLDTASVCYSSGPSSSPSYYSLPPLPSTPPVGTAADADYKLPQLIGSVGDRHASSFDSSSSSSSSSQSSPLHSERHRLTRRVIVHRSRSHSIYSVGTSRVSRAAAARSHSATTGRAHRPATSVASNACLPPTPTQTPPPVSTAHQTTAPTRVCLQRSASPDPHPGPHLYEEPACADRGTREADHKAARMRSRDYAQKVHSILDKAPFTVTVTFTRHVPAAREWKTSRLQGAAAPRAEIRYSRLRSNNITRCESSVVYLQLLSGSSHV